jgi:hypothetical protein
MWVLRFEIADLKIAEKVAIGNRLTLKKLRLEIATPGLFEEFLYSFSQLIQ